MTYGDLRAEYAPYENFDAFKNRRIYSCNTGLVPYYEEFPFASRLPAERPDLGVPSGIAARLQSSLHHRKSGLTGNEVCGE